jgi:hypothetical protein
MKSVDGPGGEAPGRLMDQGILMDSGGANTHTNYCHAATGCTFLGMKQIIISLLGSLFILTLCGCEETRFAQYNGQPQAWPTGSSFTDKVYDLPVFRGWPEKAYDVLGYIEFTNPNIDWNEGDIKQAARKAKKLGGDALLIIGKGDVVSPSLGKVRTELGISTGRTVAVVLKWK